MSSQTNDTAAAAVQAASAPTVADSSCDAAPEQEEAAEPFAELTEPQMVDLIRSGGYAPGDVIKLLVLGNSGAGKSFLCNVVAGQRVFEHKFQADSVTTGNSFVGLPLGSKLYVVSNIPGLIEAKAENLERNKAAITAAIGFQPQSPTVVMFVVTLKGGRPVTEDLTAIKVVLDFAEVQPGSVALVVNGLDVAEFEGDSEDEEVDEAELAAVFRAQVIGLIREVVPIGAAQIEFTAKVGPKLRNKHASPELEAMRNQLLGAVHAAVPAVVQVEEGKELDLEGSAVRDVVERKLAEQQAAFERDMAERGAAWDARMNEQEAAARQQAAQQAAAIATLQLEHAAAQERAQQEREAEREAAEAEAAAARARHAELSQRMQEAAAQQAANEAAAKAELAEQRESSAQAAVDAAKNQVALHEQMAKIQEEIQAAADRADAADARAAELAEKKKKKKSGCIVA